ncbi:hypothetical protein V5O48_007594, partial [Marasmius crinis-equi]
MAKKKGPAYYAVQAGRIPGVYNTWDECEAQVKGFTGAKHKKFATREEAEQFARLGNGEFIDLLVPGSTSNPEPVRGQKRAAEDEQSHTDSASTVPHKKPKTLHEYQADGEGDLIVYSDGACKGNGKQGSAAGVGVWWGHGDPRNIAERCPGDQTNNRAELIAISRVLESTPINTKRRLVIKTDSKYSIQCFESWIHKWRKNNWKNADREPVKNAAVIRYISTLLEGRIALGQKVKLEYVKGHAGIEGNEGADHMANLGALESATEERDWPSLEEEYRKTLNVALDDLKGDASRSKKAAFEVEAP